MPVFWRHFRALADRGGRVGRWAASWPRAVKGGRYTLVFSGQAPRLNPLGLPCAFPGLTKHLIAEGPISAVRGYGAHRSLRLNF